MTSGYGEAWRRAEEAVLRHCIARGLLAPRQVGELRAEAAAAGASVLTLVARSVPTTSLDELRRVHRDALAADSSSPPLLRGASTEDAEAPWQDADTFVQRGSTEREGTERFAADRANEPAATEESPTVREATTIPLPGAPPHAADLDGTDTVRDAPAVRGSGETTVTLVDGAPLPLPAPGGPPGADARPGLSGAGPGYSLASTRADVSASSIAPRTPDANVPVLIGPFPVQGELGRGRTGVVYRAWHAELGREVAIKVPPPGCGSDVAAGFLATARAMARLRHPSVVTVHEVGETEGRPYMVTDLVGDRTLEAVLRDEAPLAPRDAAQVARALALGLAEGHRRGVLHRAIRPRNVVMAGPLEPVLTDFGLPAGAAASEVTYLAPEEAAGRPVDARADLHALGALLYALLTGEPPFPTDDLDQALAALRGGEVVPPSQLVEGVDADLEAVCLRCLEPDPVDRHASAQDLADDLRRWLDGEPVQRASVLRRLRRWAHRQPALAAAFGLLALLAIGLTALAALLLARR
ncbi:MAG: serine/threonine protein kinase [Planctomycetota bacterium]|nr:serine/threonine protein kinase [Planctomycetota bacterium]